jgi:hypothetical protein
MYHRLLTQDTLGRMIFPRPIAGSIGGTRADGPDSVRIYYDHQLPLGIPRAQEQA